MTEVVIVINPGSTSTKFALWAREGCISEHIVRHDAEKLVPLAVDQLNYRTGLIEEAINPMIADHQVIGVVGRGGLLKPMDGGTYSVNEKMINDLHSSNISNHASNLGALIAQRFAKRLGVQAYIVDPVTVDEFVDVARVSGVRWCERKSRTHALNIKFSARRAANELGKELEDTRFVIAHLGGGTTIAAVLGGKIIDANDALHGMGPFSPERAGALPIGPVIEHCFTEGVVKKDLLDDLARKSGLMAYCGTSDVRDVLKMIDQGDEPADLALRAMIYQDAKEIGAMGAVLEGWIDAVVITGGLAHSIEVVGMLRPYIAYLGEVLVYPGEGELEALAAGAFRVIDGVEKVKEYR